MSFFNYLFDSRYTASILIYVAIFCIVTALVFCANRFQHRKNKSNLLYFGGFLIAWFFYAFNDVGNDLSHYINIYNASDLSTSWINTAGLEIGYRFINAALHEFISDAYIGVGLIKTIQIACVFYSIWMMRKDIHIGYSIMAYLALFYFQSFNLIRLSLAGGLCCLSSVLYYKGKKWLPTILGLISATIHTSALLYIVTIIIYLIYVKSKWMKPIVRFLLIVSVPIVIFLAQDIVLMILSSGRFMDRYDGYVNVDGTFGIMQIIYYIPVAFTIVSIGKMRNKTIETRTFYEQNFIYALCGFVIAICGYSMGMLERAAIYFSAPFLFLIPFYIRNHDEFPSVLRIKFTDVTCRMMFLIYFIIRFILALGGIFIYSGLYDFKLVF